MEIQKYDSFSKLKSEEFEAVIYTLSNGDTDLDKPMKVKIYLENGDVFESNELYPDKEGPVTMQIPYILTIKKFKDTVNRSK